MKNNIIKILKRKSTKRIVSGLTAFVMAFGTFPITDIGNDSVFFDLFSISASAADDDTPPDNYEFLHDSDNMISLTIDEFYKYSQSYSTYPGYHQNDKITIKTSSGGTAYYERGFKGLGTSTKPFAGSIEIEANKDIVLNLDAPLFSYVTDTAVLNNGDTLKIARFYGHKIPSGETIKDTTPLIAENVVLDSENPNKPKATWNISVVKPSATDDELLDGTLAPFGGMIGTMAASTQLTLNVTMDQQTGDTDSIELKSKSNLGLACGLIKQNATLSFSIGASEGGTIRNISKIGTSSGNVGGLVGEMESGSTFNYTGTNIQEDNTAIETKSGYAGGIVGKMDSATLTFSDTTYLIKQYMSGTKGVGGIYGYYNPKSNENTIDLTKYNIDGQVNCSDKANIGGLFGEFVCDHSFTIDTDTTVKSKHASGEAASYGGLIGKYTNTSLSNTLTIGGVTTETKNESGKGVVYGGAIGIADAATANYIKFDGFKVDKAYNADKLTFGGLIGFAKNSFVDANNVTIKVDGTFYGGGLVGDLGNGSLRMTSTTDLSNAKSVAPTGDAYKYGQIVGNRDSALVFAEDGWILKRSAAVEADDIGAWGEVIRFDSKETDTETETDDETGDETTYNLTYEQFDSNTVLRVNETTHTISIADSPDTISTTADFALTALNMQIGSGDIVTSGTGVDNITLEDDISLSGTGFTGFTRDNNAGSNLDLSDTHCVFDGSFSASGNTVTLAIGEPYGYRGESDLSEAATRTSGDGRIYNHRFNGLFGILKGTEDTSFGSVDDDSITIDGTCSVSPKANRIYVGAVAAVAKEKVNVYKVDVSTIYDFGGSKNVYLGGLVGEINAPTAIEAEETPEIEITNCTFSGSISGENDSDGTCLGGIAGKIFHTTNEEQYWSIREVSVSGTIENSATRTEQMVGGLIAIISGYSSTDSYNSRTLELSNVTTTNLELKGGAATSMGGMLGYQWLNTDVVFGVVDEDTSVTIDSGSKVTASGSVKDMAGLVYNGTGKWTVNKLNIDGIEIVANTPRSFGMIINKGWYCDSEKNYKSDGSSSAIYLILNATDCYTISGSTLNTLVNASVYDELVAYSAYYRDDGDNRYGTDASGDEYILKNGNGVVSIHIATVSEDDDETLVLGLVMDGGDNASNSYQAQTSLGAKPNPWTRYYYDLDVITNPEYGYSGQNAGKLMLWGLNKYAHQSIKSNFADPFTNNSINVNNVDYDMTGYSWYPVDVDFSVSVKGNFKFVNKEFELSEAENAGTHNSQKSSISTTYNNVDYKTQHYLMHCGLFRNVYSGKTVTINSNTRLRGNVAKADKYCGVLICGTVDGSSDTNKATITINNLELQGVSIHNIKDSNEEFVDYAPLLINKITKYTNLTVKNVKTSTTSPYRYIDSIPYIQKDSGGFPKAGSSLIGEVGSSTAKGLNLVFETIQLDGRTAALSDTTANNTLNTKYRTNRTIFTKATLLDKFEFESGSKGKYTYTWTHDWGSNSQKKVTYGKEVGYITEGEFPNQERQYFEGSTADAEEYTNPGVNNDTNGETVSTILRNSFLPYVATPYDPNGTTHQLEVNHRTSNAEGCGTYNDPYIITKASELQNIALIINGGATTGTKITLPNATERSEFWCDDKTGKSHHKVFEYNGSNFINGDTSLTSKEVRTYLASAYYQIGDNFTLDSFDGISNFNAIDSSNNFAVFRGVIDGNDFTITNKSASPLIVNSYGCVIKDLTVSVEKESANISLTQANATDTFPTCISYGGLIANILGGDNIIDGASVNYNNMKKGFTIGNNNYGHLIPVGGYVGVIVDGALIFKNMSNSTQGLSTIPSSYLSQLTNQKYLYVNPIIGRVINGYAVTEGSEYVTSEDDVTMHNGTKNYSIADITKSNNIAMLSTGAYTSIGTSSYSTDVSIPNAQALFVMSLLTQSSTTVGNPSTLALGSSGSYGGTYHRMRCAAYSAVGTNAANDNKPADYTVAVADHTSTSVPFLVKNYTNVISGTTNYGVLALTNNNTVCNFNLGGTETEWTLPDGFRGIGCIGFKRSDLTNRTISLHKFSGKNNNGAGSVVTITMNMSLQHYEAAYDNYLPVSNSQGGFGLFDTLHHNRSDQGTKADDYKISNLNITGNINYYVFLHSDPNGVMVYKQDNIYNSSYLNTGGIAGFAGFSGNDSITVDTIGVSGLTVEGFETAGGFFGNLQLSANSATSHQVSISDIDAQKAFTVHSKRYAGGIIGYFKQGNLNISDVTIKLPTVLNEYKGQDTSADAKDFDNGAGGIIGYCQNVNGNSPVELSNIVLGQLNKDTESRIGYIEGYTCLTKEANVVAGGLIGRNNTYKGNNNYSLKIEDCNVYNISIYGHRVGGLIGSDAADNNANTQSKILIYNSNVKSDNDSILYGLLPGQIKHRACGGLMGGSRASNGVIVDSCSVEGYTLQGYQDTAGICANVDGGGFGVRNFMIKDVVLKSDYAAALFGWLPKALTGYNILCDNVQFQDRNGGTIYNSAQHGYLVSKNNGKSIKIVGLSIQNATPKSSAYFIPPRLSGTENYNANGGYIIFADYNGAASNSNRVFSDINGSANVKDYNNQVVSDNNPYVTSSPKIFIGTNQFLTGDAVSSTTYNGSAFKQIILDKQDAQKSQNGAQSYQTAPDVNTSLLNDVTDHLKPSREEFGTAFPYNFPLLEVEDSDRTKVTNYINYYLRNLTNTNYDFSLASNNSAIKDIFKVTLHSCVYDKTTRTFTVDPAENSGSLKHYAGAFQMEPGSIDNADPTTPQFTLMDVQFYDPADKTKIAYHLYVPIYVKKEINYKFSAQIASGTNYYEGAYTGITSKTLFENLGNSVTMRIEYTYDRTTTEWADAINGGENVLDGSNYFKELKMSMNSNGWAPDSRLVLVDANNNDKHYYMDSSIATADANGIYHIPFDSFTANGASGGTAYKPVAMSSLLEYTITATNNGPLVVTTDASKATVKSPDGNTMYMPRPDGNSAQGYTATVTNVNPEVYYLSFFTNKNSGNDKVYHYEINSVERFEQHSTDNENWKPNKIIRSYNVPVHLIIGNLYTNNKLDLSVTPRVASTYEMTKSNNVLTVTMTSHISLTQAAKDEKIPQNLAQNLNSTIYQTFLMNYDMMEKDALTSKIGVNTSAIQSVTITDYKIYYGLTVPTEEADLEANPGEDVSSIASDPEDLMNSNYIELRNNKNLNEYLRNSTSGHDNAATIQVTFAIEYAEKNLSKQFPERKDESDSSIGSLVRGFSNISSVAESGAYSAISLPASDTHRYYTKNISSANLTYNAEKTMNSPNGQYSSLGINPFDEQTAKVVTNKGHIDSTAIYSYIDIVDPGEYIEFNLTLTCKNDGGYDKIPLVISDYLNDLTIKANNTTLYSQGSSSDTSVLKAFTSSDGKTITLRAHKSQLKEIADKIYTIDISYDVLTGEANGFGSTKAYSNYKVALTADIYDAIDTSVSPDNPTHASDHIIYTNSKLQYNMIS